MTLLRPLPARAELPAAKEALREVGFSGAEIQRALAGEIVRRMPEAASEQDA